MHVLTDLDTELLTPVDPAPRETDCAGLLAAELERLVAEEIQDRDRRRLERLAALRELARYD